MRHPSRWSTGGSFLPSLPTHHHHHHHHHPPRPRRRGTVVTESTRFSIASSSNRLSCVDIDSEGCGDCEWDANYHNDDVVPKGEAAAAEPPATTTTKTTLQAASSNQNNKGGRELPKHQKQGMGTGGSSSKSNPPRHALAKLFPWKKRQQRSSTSSKTQTTPTRTTKTKTTITTTSSSPASTTIIHESKLRKKVQHYAQIDDWDSIRKLLSKHPFSNIIPEKVIDVSRKRRDSTRSSSSRRVEKINNHSNHNDVISPAYANEAKHGKNQYNRRRSTSRLSMSGSGHPLVDCSSRDDDDDDDDDDVENVDDKIAGGYGGIGNTTTCRRPSYESYSSGRRSFTGKESAAAAAAIQHAAMFDCESSEDSCDHDDDDNDDGIGNERVRSCDDVNGGRGCGIQQQRSPTSILRCRASTTTATRDGRPDIGENLLHDICRYQPPLDVLEMILLGLRDRYYRGDFYTIGTDSLGQTPLHVAAACGAHWTIIDALVRLDPTPASMGDAHHRSPLHLAVKKQIDDWKGATAETEPRKQRWRSHWWAKYPHCRQASCKDGRKTSERTPEDIFRIAQLLKDAMLTYPGKIDFSGEDMMGYSPLDYAIESGILETSLIRTLIQRNFTHEKFRALCCSDSFRLVQPTSNCEEDPANTSTSIDNDTEFLNALDHSEKEALIAKIQNLNPNRLKMWMEYKPFKILMDAIVANNADGSTNTSNKEKPQSSSPRVDMSCQLESPCHAHHGTEVMTYEEIYNKHLQDYFDGYMHDLELGDIQHFDQDDDDDDSFDIFVDPEEWDYGNDAECTAMLLMNGATSRPLSEISVVEDDDCVSVLSIR